MVTHTLIRDNQGVRWHFLCRIDHGCPLELIQTKLTIFSFLIAAFTRRYHLIRDKSMALLTLSSGQNYIPILTAT